MTEINRQLAGERRPLAEMIAVALPTVVTMSSFTVMQFVDALMVSRIGPETYHIAAQGNGGMANWVALSFFFGATSVINTYVAQNIGAGKPEKAAGYGWTGGWLALGYWPLMLIAALLMPTIFGRLGHEGELIRNEVAYAQILLVGSIFKLSNKGFSEFFFGVQRPMVVTISVIAGNLANFFANYVLIFGRVTVVVDEGAFFGAGVVNAVFAPINAIVEPLDDRLPALGVVGAAYGTVFGYFIEFAVQQAVFLGKRYHSEFKTRSAWRVDWGKLRDVCRLGWPSGVQISNEMACWWFLMAFLLGAGGKAAAAASGVTDEAAIVQAGAINNAAGWIALRYMHAAFLPAIGLSIAVTAIVGRYMGAGRPDLAAQRAWLGVRISLIYLGSCGIAMVVFREPMISLFIDANASPEQREMLLRVGSSVMIAVAFFQFGDALGVILIGALRGAGDTTWPGVANVLLSWTFLVGGGLAMVHFFPSLGSIGPWISAAVFITALGLTMMARFMGGKWRSIKLVETGPADHPDPHLHQTLPGERLSAPPDAVAGATPGSP